MSCKTQIFVPHVPLLQESRSITLCFVHGCAYDDSSYRTEIDKLVSSFKTNINSVRTMYINKAK